MNAVISGTAGRALLVDGKSLKSFDVGDPSKLVDRQRSDLPYLFGEGRDLRIIENSDIGSIAAELKSDSDSALALDLTLISLDEELEADIRQDALQDLDELLVENQLVARLENILYARPLPDDGDLVGALKFCADAHLRNALSLLQRFEEHQSVIAEVSAAWDVIPTKVFGSHELQAEFQHVGVREGLFRALVLALAKPHQLRMADAQTEVQAKLSTLFLNAGINSSVKALRNQRQVIQSWTNSFRLRGETLTIKHEIEEEERETAPRRRHGRRVDINRQAVLTEVNRRKAIISGAIMRRDFEDVSKLTVELVSYQLRSGEAKHLAKSLCDLAAEAKQLGLYSLQLELTERSISVAPDDSWSWIQHADALLSTGRLDESLHAYQQAHAFGAGVIAKAGEAEVLKAQGLFREALTVLEKLIVENPGSAIAYNSRADALRALGRLEDALAAYTDVLIHHPDDIVSRTGRAEVLRALGLFDEALLAYNEIIAEYPEDIIARNGRDELLNTKAELYDSLIVHNEMMAKHPEDVTAEVRRDAVLAAIGQLNDALVTYNGLSSVLAAKGRYHEALRCLPRKSPINLQDWNGYYIRGLILLFIGQVTEAVRIFNEGLQKDSSPGNQEHFRSALVVERLKDHDFEKASQILDEIISPSLQSPANILRIHAFGALGDTKSAAQAHMSLAPSTVSKELVEELHRRYVLHRKPLRTDEWILEQELMSLLASS